MGAPFTELEKPLEEASLLCRGCLADSGEMKDMLEWGLVEDFSKATLVQIDNTNLISQLLCTTCEEKLESCKQFQTMCAQSDVVLKTLSKRPETTCSPQYELKDNTTSCLMYNNQLIVLITAPDTTHKIHLPCPYQCADKFLKKQDLFNHLFKNHQVKSDFTIDLQYYCNHKHCPYHPLSKLNKWFSGRKFLNQHVNKVHKSKIFSCSYCQQKFSTNSDFTRHLRTCNMTFSCPTCDKAYNSNEKLLVHLMRKHPDLHKKYKEERRASKRKAKIESDNKKAKADGDKLKEFICDSPKRSLATQTQIEVNIKNDVALPPWILSKGDFSEAKTDEISTQTVFEDLLSLKSQNSEDDSLFFSETVSLSDIQTQTFPIEFGLSRSDKETVTSQTQSPDLSMKETQTCFCLYDSPRNLRFCDNLASSPNNLTSTETQTGEPRSNKKSDVLLSCTSAQTQTSFQEDSEAI